MFYPIDLLSRRQRGKFAASWLASTNSEASFKKLYVSNAIKKMNVVQTCNDILEVIQFSNGKLHERFSLYLSSQLMYGITKIYSYQVDYYQKDIFKFEENLNPFVLSKKKGNRFDDFEDIECPDIELPKDFFSTQLLREDLHILPGGDLHDMLEIAMQDEELLNFGCLNDEELELFLGHNNISLEENILKQMADITITEEIHRHSSQKNISPVLVDISKRIHKSKGKVPVTPQKRQPQIQPETPTKKRRLFETASVPTTEDITVPLVEDIAEPIPTPELPAEKTAILVPSQQIEMELESLHSTNFVIAKHSKKTKIIDQKIVLTDKQLQKWRQNIKIQSKQSDNVVKSIERLTPAINLLKEPSYLPKRWNTSLRNLFVDHITGPFINVDEDVAPTDFVELKETMLVEETISKQNLPTKDMSTFTKMDTTIAADPANSILPISIAHLTASIPPSPERIHTITLEEDISSSDGISLISPNVSSEDILSQLEVFWFEEPCVKLSQLIPKDEYTAEDAAAVFSILLELHAQKKLILQQAECFRTLRIWRIGKLN
ncbi:PREDICTED: uncharacterized protein LOC108780577 [Cyphomyrmex costatus]|uniref:uncharacterized protein LOC108780577 n=1 Tax=Cyphomyrmex costatus TaxID=456900 RepID=UPI0008522976|nr:PREDICTED: uncharacterized protein LOC108780577 [Cyphomyrmex costatus]